MGGVSNGWLFQLGPSFLNDLFDLAYRVIEKGRDVCMRWEGIERDRAWIGEERRDIEHDTEHEDEDEDEDEDKRQPGVTDS